MSKSQQIKILTEDLTEVNAIARRLRAELIQQRKSTDYFVTLAKNLRIELDEANAYVRQMRDTINRLKKELDIAQAVGYEAKQERDALKADRANLLYVIEGYLDDRVNTEAAINGLCDTISAKVDENEALKEQLGEANSRSEINRKMYVKTREESDGWRQKAYNAGIEASDLREDRDRYRNELNEVRRLLDATLSKSWDKAR